MHTLYNAYKSSVTGIRLAFGLALLLGVSSCKKILEVDPPKARLDNTSVFGNDITATSAVYGIYDMLNDDQGFAGGTSLSVTALAGLSADELVSFSGQNMELLEFEANNIRPANSRLSPLWASFYSIIYQANAAMENMQQSNGLTEAVKRQLRGECMVLRAFSHFYACNVFGEIPIVMASDYEKNALVARQPVEKVYQQVIADLQESIGLLAEEYPAIDEDFVTRSRARINKYAAMALLSRVYLYHKDWDKAEQLASGVIANAAHYELLDDPDNIFLMNSREAVWQLRPRVNYTNEAYHFVAFYTNYNVLDKALVASFENGDLRKEKWIREINPGDSVFYPYKYKQVPSSDPIREYSMIIRLAELYLIRAEARTHQGNVTGAITDIDKIRQRANLPLIQNTSPSISSEDLLLAIERERRAELFTEWGHRWLDLKRTNRAMAVLGPVKPTLQQTDLLYPVPASEFRLNPKLGTQNAGY